MRASAIKCLHKSLPLLVEVAVYVISLTGITHDLETEMLILTMYLKQIFQKVKYLRKVFKYNYFSFIKIIFVYKYFETSI